MNKLSYPAGYLPARGRAQALVAFLWTTAALNALVTLLGMFALPALQGVAAHERPELGEVMVMLAYALAVLLRAGTYLTTMVLVPVWVYRAVTNLKALQPDVMMSTSAGMAAGCWFIPFYNLGKPFSVMRDLWTDAAFLTDEGSLHPRGRARVGFWWAAYLLGNVVTNAGEKMAVRLGEPGVATLAVGAALHIVAALLLVRIVRGIDGHLDDKARRMALDGVRYPLPPGTAPVIA